MGKLWYIYTMQYYTVVKMNQLENLHMSEWLKLKVE